MVRQYYVPQITQLSEQELQSVFDVVRPPVCLLGGWAVHLHVTPGFEDATGRQYIGSRDIDIGVHVDPAWSPETLQTKPVGRSLTAIRDLEYTDSRFGFVQHFHRETQERISEVEASQYDMHEIFQVYIDVIPDTDALAAFDDTFGFRPPAEPLLKPVFDADAGKPLADHVSWSVADEVMVAPPELLAAMKIQSLPDREKSHKRVKDVTDLHALLWYVDDYTDMKTAVLEHTTDEARSRLEAAIDDTLFESAAQLLQIDPSLVDDSIRGLLV